MPKSYVCSPRAATVCVAPSFDFFSLYGPELRKQILWDIGRRLIDNPPVIQLFGSGEETRDFVYVEDAVELVSACGAAASCEPLVVNGGTGSATRVRDVANAVVRALGRSTKVQFSGVTRKGDPEHYCADTSRADALGFRCHWSLERGLAAWADWFFVTLPSPAVKPLRRKPLVIGLEMFSAKEWIGGAIYLRNLVYTLAALPPTEQPQLRLLYDELAETDLVDDLRNFAFVDRHIADRRATTNFRLAHRVWGAARRRASWLFPGAGLGELHIVYPGFGPTVPGSVHMHWIPDFQHLVLPEFFSIEECKRRTSAFAQIAAKRTMLVLSSRAALGDFQRFFPDAVVTPRVWSFCSVFFGTRARWAGSPRDIPVAREVRLRSQSILAPQGSHYCARGSRPAAPARAGDSASMYRARARYSLSRLFRRADVAGSRARCIRPGSHPRDGTRVPTRSKSSATRPWWCSLRCLRAGAPSSRMQRP